MTWLEKWSLAESQTVSLGKEELRGRVRNTEMLEDSVAASVR